jgi:hypothetical protein
MAEVVHLYPPDGYVTTPCCGRDPGELPRADRLTQDPSRVTCYADMRDLVLGNHAG